MKKKVGNLLIGDVIQINKLHLVRVTEFTVFTSGSSAINYEFIKDLDRKGQTRLHINSDIEVINKKLFKDLVPDDKVELEIENGRKFKYGEVVTTPSKGVLRGFLSLDIRIIYPDCPAATRIDDCESHPNSEVFLYMEKSDENKII